MATKKRIPPKGNPHASVDRKGHFKPPKKGKPNNRYESIAESFEMLARATRSLAALPIETRVKRTQTIVDGMASITETLSAIE